MRARVRGRPGAPSDRRRGLAWLARPFDDMLLGLSSWVVIGSLTGVLSQFSPPSGDICPGSDIEFSCVGNSESISTTHWEITPDGGDPACVVLHNIPELMQNCGPDRIFTSSLTGRTGLNYTSSLRAEDVPLSLNGTMVECVDGADLQTIGSTNICIVGKHDPFHCVYVDNISQICWSPPCSRVIQSVELEMRRTCVY